MVGLSKNSEENSSPPESLTSNGSEVVSTGKVESESADQPSQPKDVRFLIAAGAVFFVVMLTQYVMLVLDKPQPIPWQQGEASRLFRVDVNTAGWAEWTQLDDLGADLAMRIVADREANGAFREIDDLLRVEGIGRTTLDRIRPSLTISDDPQNEHERN